MWVHRHVNATSLAKPEQEEVSGGILGLHTAPSGHAGSWREQPLHATVHTNVNMARGAIIVIIAQFSF